MTGRKQALFAAVSSTACAAVWLVNCVLDVAYGLTGELTMHVLMTGIWTLCAACWWGRARRIGKPEC